jgi:Secretion system C-terminal sorting domain
MNNIVKSIIILLVFFSIFNFSYSQWVELYSGVNSSLNSVSVSEPNIRWICGDSGIVLKSSYGWPINFYIRNGGIPSNVKLTNIFAFDTALALTAGNIGNVTYVYRTSNGGYNWAQVFNQTNGSVNAVLMRNLTSGFMEGNPVGGRWSLWKTINGGINWDSSGMYLPQSGGETGWNNSIFFIDSGYSSSLRKLWFGTNNSRIYYSSNFGINWSAQSTAPDSNSFSLLFHSFQTNNGLSGGNSLEMTTNGGLNWVNNNSIGSGRITGLGGNDPGVFDYVYAYEWYIRSDNKIYYSSSGGSSWIVQYTAPSGIFKYMSQVGHGGSGEIFGVRDNGGISYCGCTPSGIESNNNSIPNEYSLSQNYPNPFNPVTKIKFSLPSVRSPLDNPSEGGAISTRLIIYDVLGREVVTLLNEQLHPGSYSVDWDASNYPSGVYFYKLEAGVYIQTKKMVLIK